jgi:hypothetical protein
LCLQIFKNQDKDSIPDKKLGKGVKQLVNRTLVIGSKLQGKADCIRWTQPFCDMDQYDYLIIDLASFPKDYPPTLFNNIGLLKRTARIFIRDNKEIFCIMEKPLRIPFKKIPLNYSWIPFPQKLTVNPMILGRTIVLTDERFSEYIEDVEKWENELFWENTANCSFEPIAVNKSQNPVAATLTIDNRGKIHFLPKTTKISRSKSIKLLMDLSDGEEKHDAPSWLGSVEIPESTRPQDQWNSGVAPEEYRKLFSLDHKNVTNAVQIMLEDIGIQTLQNAEFGLIGLKDNIVVKVVSAKGKIEAQNAQVSQLARFIEHQRRNEKIVFVANTYSGLPLNKRANKEHLDLSVKLFFETNNAVFLTTVSLYNLWKKVITFQISVKEASFLLHNEKGEITI